MANGKGKKLRRLYEEVETQKSAQEAAQEEIDGLKKSLEGVEKACHLLTGQFLYLCLSWLKHRERNNIGDWRGRCRAKKDWFTFCEENFPTSKEEIRKELNKIKLGL